MKKILCFVLSAMLLLSGMTALAKPVEIELRGTDYSNYEGVKAEGYEGTVVTGDAKHWRPQDKSKIYPLAENKNEAGTGKALYLPNTQLDNITANAPGFRLVAMGDPLLLEVGKSYAMKVKMRALTPSTKDIKVESLWRPQKDYTCSATDDGQYKVTAGTPFRPVAYYPANSTEWMTVEIPPFAIKAIKNAAGENVDSMMPSGGNLPFIYIYTQDDADGNKVEFYIESAFIYLVDDGTSDIKLPPVIQSLRIEGTSLVGSTLTAAAVVNDPNGDELDPTTYEWQRFVNNEWVTIAGATQQTYTTTEDDMGKNIRVIATPHSKAEPKDGTPVTSSAFGPIGTELVNSEFYVAPDGNDSNPGTLASPFASVTKARDTIRALKDSLPSGQINVYIRGGDYVLDSAVTFDAQDSGTESKPIVYQAYNGEKVRFIGGTKINNTKVSKVTDTAVLNRVLDKQAKDCLMQIDLSDLPGTLDPIPDHGYALSAEANSSETQQTVRDYKPIEIYIGGEALKKSRWPNDEPGKSYLKTVSAKVNGSDHKTSPFTITYTDNDNHTALWPAQAISDLYITGFIANDWAGVTHKVASLDAKAKTFTSVNGTSYPPSGNHKLYFYNLLEEIDMPGESYIDRANKIAYFYPANDAATEEIYVSTLEPNMFQFNGVSNVTVKDLDFCYTVGNGINASNVDRFTIDGVTVAHTSSNAISVTGTNSTVKNSHVYDTGAGGILINGGNRTTLTNGNMLAENNRIHSVTRVYNAYKPALDMDGVGTTARNNEIYDGPHEIVTMDGNDLIFDKNEVYNAVMDASDMGAIYWGRNPSQMGYRITNNYFHHIGNPYGGHGQQAIFWDDGAMGPYLYGNIFFQGSLPTEKGGTTNNSFALKTNGGQYAHVENNIFVDSPRAAWFQDWVNGGNATEFTNNQQGMWWLWIMDCCTARAGTNAWSKLKGGGIDFESAAWVNHYKDSQWKDVWSLFSSSICNQARGYFNIDPKKKELLDMARDTAPAKTNLFRNNVSIKVAQGAPNGDPYTGNATGNAGFRRDNDKLPSGESMFVEYGKDFKLTDAGLAEVRKTIPDFKNIDTADIGLQSYQDNGVTRYVGGRVPSASNPRINGVLSKGNYAMANYTFTDPDGDTEGVSKIVWYISNSENGTYTKISGKEGKNLLIDESYVGRYIKYEVTPYDRNMLYGETIQSQPALILQTSPVDKSALSEALLAANKLLAEAVVGNEVGQFPQKAKDDLEDAINQAQSVADNPSVPQYEVNETVTELNNAVKKFNLSKITATGQLDASISRMAVNSLLSDTTHWTVPNSPDKVEFVDGSLVLGANGGTGFALANYNAGKFKNTEFTFKMKLEKVEGIEGDTWAGIYLRQGHPDSVVWQRNSGYMVDIKGEIINFQKYAGPGGTYETIDNNAIEYGKEYLVTVGAYDLKEENKVALIVTVDGAEIYSTTLTEPDLYGQEGYLGFSAGHGKLTISPVVADKTELNATLAEATAFLAEAEAGSNYGQYPQTALDALTTAKTAAELVAADGDAVQYDVDRAALAVKEARADAKAAVVASGTISANGTGDLNYDVGNGQLTLSNGVTNYILQTDTARAMPGLTVNTQTTSGNIVLQIEKGTSLSGNGWSGGLLLPGYGTQSSTSVNGTVHMAVKMGSEDAFVTADRLVRILLPGQRGKTVAYKNSAGKNIEVTKSIQEDSFAAANAALPNGGIVKLNVGNDIVIYTTYLTELVTYTKASEPTVNPPIGPGSGTTSGGSYSTGSGSPGSGSLLLGETEPVVKFTDIAGHWAQNDIEVMFRRGIVSGVTETTFEPDRSITRAEFATLVTKALQLSGSVSAGFMDVNEYEWYAPYVNAAASVGLIVGSDGYFRPDELITREEMAVIAVKALAFVGKTTGSGEIDKFADKDTISEWAKPFVDQAASIGLIMGVTPDTFDGRSYTTRAQAVSVIKRLLD